jgi:hypothetical protein
MDFLKKHYEKIILIAVLLGVVGFLVFLPFVISRDQQDMTDMRNGIINRDVKPLPDLDLTRQQDVLQRLQSSANFDFTTKNKLFNPIEWKMGANGVMFPIKNGNEIGADAAAVTKITPLYLQITLDEVRTNDVGAVYVIGVERQAAPYLRDRRKLQHFATPGEKIDAFTITAVKGAPENPDELDLKLADTGETAAVSKGKPFQRVDAYAADLKYDPEKKTFPGRRVGSTISFNGEDYIIVAIDAGKVILSSQSNEKKTTLRLAP